jgi:hypothetical protein
LTVTLLENNPVGAVTSSVLKVVAVTMACDPEKETALSAGNSALVLSVALAIWTMVLPSLGVSQAKLSSEAFAPGLMLRQDRAYSAALIRLKCQSAGSH